MKHCLAYTKLRVRAVLKQIDELKNSDFGYKSAREAVELLENVLAGHYSKLKQIRLPGNPETVAADCQAALDDINDILPVLGVILRSSNVRNAFEVYGPIRKMAQTLLNSKPSVKLILSSGWDYMPQTFRPLKWLKGFIFIIFPASESSNPLMLPLAGHELGHAVWLQEGLWPILEHKSKMGIAEYIKNNASRQWPGSLRKFSSKKILETLETDRKYETHYRRAVWLLSRQIEEYFCDFVGIYLFGESFFHAFAYCLSPQFPPERSPQYPTITNRVNQLLVAGEAFKKKWTGEIYSTPNNFDSAFQEIPVYRHHSFNVPAMPMKSGDSWQDGVDSAAIDLVPELIEKIFNLGQQKSWKALRNFSVTQKQAIKNDAYYWAVPAGGTKSLANILNAAWDVAREPMFWNDLQAFKRVSSSKREELYHDTLRELVLKNIEVLEFESLTDANL